MYRLRKFLTGKPYTKQEELVHVITHWIGSILVCLGSGSLITLAALTGSAVKIVSASVFSASMILLYCASTLYHFAQSARAKSKLKVVDHASIYLLIAGTYTPFLLVNIQGATGLTMMIVIWTMALAGVIGKIFFLGKLKKISVAVYVIMGWVIVFALKPMIELVPLRGLIFLLIGGLFYSGGVYFYIRKDKEYYHGVWHVFVLLGTIFHFFAVLYSII